MAVRYLILLSYSGATRLQVIGRRRTGWRVGEASGAGCGTVQPLLMDGRQPGEERKAQPVAERKRHGALPMTIDVLPVHCHRGAVA
jgi:hypothetical protein